MDKLFPSSAVTNAPRWYPGRRGFYEVYWLKWNDLSRKDAGWVRYVLRAPRRGETRLEVWAARLDGQRRERPRATRKSFAMSDVQFSARPFALRAPGCELTDDAAHGELVTSEGRVAWNVRFSPENVALRHLPRAFYSAPLPRGKLVGPRCFTRASATMEVNGSVHEWQAVPAQASHFWGAGDQVYGWVSCGTFREDPSAFVEAIYGKAALGPLTLPPAAFVHVRWRGRTFHLNGPLDAAKTRYEERLGHLALEARAGALRFRVGASAPPEDIAAHPFVNPDSDALVVHTSYFANVRLLVDEQSAGGWRQVDELTAESSAALDFVQRGRDPRVGGVFE